jgi:hypothetical protein
VSLAGSCPGAKQPWFFEKSPIKGAALVFRRRASGHQRAYLYDLYGKIWYEKYDLYGIWLYGKYGMYDSFRA